MAEKLHYVPVQIQSNNSKYQRDVEFKKFINKVLIDQCHFSHFKARKTEEALKAATTTTRSGRTVTKKLASLYRHLFHQRSFKFFSI